jgi:hypothetical protein
MGKTGFDTTVSDGAGTDDVGTGDIGGVVLVSGEIVVQPAITNNITTQLNNRILFITVPREGNMKYSHYH